MNETHLIAIRDAVDTCLCDSLDKAFKPVKLRRDPIANVCEYLDVNGIDCTVDFDELDSHDLNQVAAANLDARPHAWSEANISEISDYLKIYVGGSPQERMDVTPLLLMALEHACREAARGPFEIAQDRRTGTHL